jgi:alpha-L-fucosidase
MVKRTIFFVAIILFSASCKLKNVAEPVALGPVPSEAQLAWHEMELTAFIHFTINTFTDKEWGYGDEKESLFNPAETNVDQWIIELSNAGFKQVILTAKHHDGFCLWPSKFTEHSIRNSPYKNGNGDLVKEVSDACKRHGLKFGIYLSPWDRNRADYGTPAYINYYRNQLKEIFSTYGPISEMWFDGANGGDGYYGGARETRKIDGSTYYDWPATLDVVRQYEPNIIFFSDAGPGVRWVGNEKGTAGETNWNTISTDTLYAGKAGIENLLNTGNENGTKWVPAETDVSIRPGWFYHASEDSLVKSPGNLFEIYLTSVGRGSNLLLNVPPDRKGLFHENDVRSLRGFHTLLSQEFQNNLAAGSKIDSSPYRGSVDQYSPEKVIDGNPKTYWATDDAVTTGSIEIDFGKIQAVKYVILQEYITLGQRVKSFDIETLKDNSWEKIAAGTTIGHKRILKLDPVEAKKIRISITSAKACPLISNVEIF